MFQFTGFCQKSHCVKSPLMNCMRVDQSLQEEGLLLVKSEIVVVMWRIAENYVIVREVVFGNRYF